MGKVSIIIPVYNGSKFISECIESVQNQTFKDIEIIVIDDGSIDNTGDIVKQYMENDKRIRYEYINNSGPGVARNRGIEISNGEFICFVDSDDIISYNMIEVLYKVIISNSIDVVTSDIVKMNTRIALKSNKSFKESIYKGTEVVKKMFENNSNQGFTFTPGKLYKKEFLVKNNILFEDIYYCEDIIFNFHVFINTKNIIHINNAYYNYFINEESLTNKYDINMDDKLVYIIRKLKELIDKYNINVEKYFNGYILNSFSNFINNEFRSNNRLNHKIYKIKNSKVLNLYSNNIINSYSKGIKIKFLKNSIKHNYLDFYLIIYFIYKNLKNIKSFINFKNKK